MDGWTELILFIIYFFFVRLFLHIIIYYDNCFNDYVLPTLFLLVNTFLLILHVFNIAFIVISSIFIKRLKNTRFIFFYCSIIVKKCIKITTICYCKIMNIF